MSRKRLPAVALLAVTALASCAGGVADLGGGDHTAALGVFKGAVTLTGELGVAGTFTDAITSRHETCASYAHGIAPGATQWVVPTPDDATTVAGHTVTYTAGVPGNLSDTGYHGPGTYTGASALIAVLVIDNASFLPDGLTRATITVTADGGGSMSFSGLPDTSTGARESGTLRWTCSGPAGVVATSTPTRQTGSSSGGLGPLLSGAVSMNGAYQVTAPFTARAEMVRGRSVTDLPPGDDCASYATRPVSNATSFAAPAVRTSGSTTTLYLTITIAAGYHGPGTYASASTPMLTGSATVGVGDVNGSGYIDTFRSGFPGNTTITVHPDGSGSASFADWGGDGTTISGMVSWACH